MNYIKNFTVIFAILMAFFILPNLVSAHNGSQDELSGHFRNADCMYLLHEPTSIAKSAGNIGELIRLINQYNSNSDCAAGLSEEKVDLEGYTFPGARNPEPESSQAASEMAKPKFLPANWSLEKCIKQNCQIAQTAILQFL
ncbi:hypothetical protein [Mesobacillus sp.]|uniref:hypothetical protein n=1 Tax=Mesobacillus sp. TaxID=2675271 RepID=UPI0039EEFD97